MTWSREQIEWTLSAGLYHFGQRYYDPTLGRWTQPDPLNQASDLRRPTRTCTSAATRSTTPTRPAPESTGVGCKAGAGVGPAIGIGLGGAYGFGKGVYTAVDEEWE